MTLEEEIEISNKMLECNNYLIATDHKFLNGYKPKVGENLFEIENLRDEARAFIRSNGYDANSEPTTCT